jgi:very-short-patch-repair endonuclease
VYEPEQRGGRVAQRFGPINGAAGDRRLNVLFARAKEKVVIFSSMQPADVIPTATSRRGVVILKHYLEYALSGRIDPGLASGREPDSDFEVFVADRLRHKGLEVVPQVGVAGYFIDLAVKDPGDPQRYLLGIECDGASYHSAKSARDRDHLRQEILEQKGWRLYRIWSTDWFHDPERKAKKLLNHLHALTGRQWPG